MSFRASDLVANRYEVRRKLGEGRFAEVYEVADSDKDEELLALKIDRKAEVKTVKAEYATLRRLGADGCRHVVRVHDGAKAGGRWFMTMELLGPNLAIARKTSFGGRLDLGQAKVVGAQLLAALEELHRRGFVHRDVKPANFVLSPPGAPPASGEWVLIDLGLARRFVDEQGAALPERPDAAFRGSSTYASMPNLEQRDQGRRDDLWSWYYMLAELVDGSLPWRADRDAAATGGGHPDAAQARAGGRAGGAAGAREQILAAKKECMADPGRLFSAVPCPPAMRAINDYLATLSFSCEPNYSHLRKLLQRLEDLGEVGAANGGGGGLRVPGFVSASAAGGAARGAAAMNGGGAAAGAAAAAPAPGSPAGAAGAEAMDAEPAEELAGAAAAAAALVDATVLGGAAVHAAAAEAGGKHEEEEEALQLEVEEEAGTAAAPSDGVRDEQMRESSSSRERERRRSGSRERGRRRSGSRGVRRSSSRDRRRSRSREPRRSDSRERRRSRSRSQDWRRSRSREPRRSSSRDRRRSRSREPRRSRSRSRDRRRGDARAERWRSRSRSREPRGPPRDRDRRRSRSRDGGGGGRRRTPSLERWRSRSRSRDRRRREGSRLEAGERGDRPPSAAAEPAPPRGAPPPADRRPPRPPSSTVAEAAQAQQPLDPDVAAKYRNALDYVFALRQGALSEGGARACAAVRALPPAEALGVLCWLTDELVTGEEWRREGVRATWEGSGTDPRQGREVAQCLEELAAFASGAALRRGAGAALLLLLAAWPECCREMDGASEHDIISAVVDGSIYATAALDNVVRVVLPTLHQCARQIIMDGNSRWAAARGLPAAAGHRAGVEALRRAVAECLALGIEALTVFAFSAENWHRPAMEIELLLRLVESTLAAELEGLHQQGVRLAFVGERHALPRSLAAAAAAAETATAGGAALALAVCLGYGGQQDLAAAARAVAARVAAGELALDDVTADVLAAHLGTARLGDLQSPDLLIRPGGEMRASNFLLFEGAYAAALSLSPCDPSRSRTHAEWVFTPTLWPDFTEEHLREALREYSRRQRRFGRR
eukprot:scaffold11.g3946.t1